MKVSPSAHADPPGRIKGGGLLATGFRRSFSRSSSLLSSRLSFIYAAISFRRSAASFRLFPFSLFFMTCCCWRKASSFFSSDEAPLRNQSLFEKRYFMKNHSEGALEVTSPTLAGRTNYQKSQLQERRMSVACSMWILHKYHHASTGHSNGASHAPPTVLRGFWGGAQGSSANHSPHHRRWLCPTPASWRRGVSLFLGASSTPCRPCFGLLQQTPNWQKASSSVTPERPHVPATHSRAAPRPI